jgi:hypothetical protein
VDHISDPLLPRKPGRAGNRTRTSGFVARDHRGGPYRESGVIQTTVVREVLAQGIMSIIVAVLCRMAFQLFILQIFTAAATEEFRLLGTGAVWL